MQKQQHGHSCSGQTEANSAVLLPSSMRLWRPQLRRYVDCLRAHRCQACKQECSRKPLPIHFAVNLVRCFLDAVRLKQARQYLVGYPPLIHLHGQQFLHPVLPRGVGNFRAQLQRLGHGFGGRCRLTHWFLTRPDNKGKKLETGHIRPTRHFSVGAVPTRSHPQDF